MAASPQNAMLQDRPVLDEATFQQLLAAAYVLQEHSDKLNAQRPRLQVVPPPLPLSQQPAAADYSRTLSEIVETQALIHTHQLDFQGAIQLVAQRVKDLTHASAATVGMIEDQQICYRAATGNAATESGARFAPSQTLASECLGTGTISECHDAEQDPSVPSELWVRTGTRSFIAVPIYHENRIAGVLEARFSEANAFGEHDVRTCQLMAGLIGEAISRAAELEWKRALAAERATMVAVLEKIKPQLDRLANETVTTPRARAKNEAPVAKPSSCRGCGEPLGLEEGFCGVCGMRVATGGDIQSKWASMWHLQEAAERKKAASTATASSTASAAAAEGGNIERSEASATQLAITLSPDDRADKVALTTTDNVALDHPWTSAARARKWLESISAKHPVSGKFVSFWRKHRAKFYMVVAGVLLVVALSGWGTSIADGSRGQNGAHPQEPRLTLVEQALVTLGIAEAPPAPEYVGNPDTPVWEDIHTATYYCPGADFYGKTEGGKYTTQHQAQIDQFEAASRRVCK